MSKNKEVVLTTSITTYKFTSLLDAWMRVRILSEDRRISERETAKFIIQLFHQIPNELYNDIIDEQ